MNLTQTLPMSDWEGTRVESDLSILTYQLSKHLIYSVPGSVLGCDD